MEKSSRRDKLSRIAHVILGVLYAINDRTGQPKGLIGNVILPVLVIVVDFLQMLACAFTGWSSLVFGWTKSFQVERTLVSNGPELLATVYWCSAAFFGFALCLTMLVAYSFQKNSLRHRPITILRIVVPLMAQACYLPFLRIFAGGAVCLLGSCNHDPPFIYGAVSVAILPTFVLFCAVLNSVYYSSDPCSEDWNAKAHGRLGLLYVFLQTALVLTEVMLSQRALEYRAVVTLTAGTMLAMYSILQPYFCPYMNRLRCCLFAMVTEASILSFVFEICPHLDPSLSLPITLSSMAGCVVLAYFAYKLPCLVAHRFQSPFRSRSSRYMQSQRSAPFLDNSSSFPLHDLPEERAETPSTDLKRSLSFRRNSGTAVMAFSILDGTQQKNGSAKASMVLFGRRIDKNAPDPSLVSQVRELFKTPLTSTFFNEAWVEIQVRHLLMHKGAGPDTLLTAEALYKDAVESLPDSAFIHGSYASFLFSIKLDTVAAFRELAIASKKKSAPDIRFWLSSLSPSWEQRQNSSGIAIKALNFTDVVALKQLYEDAVAHHNKTLDQLKKMWAFLSSTGNVELSSEQVSHMVRKIHEGCAKAKTAYRNLIQKFPDSKMLLRSYSVFLQEVALDPDLAEVYLARSEEIEQSEIKANVQDESASVVSGVEKGSASSGGSKRAKAKTMRLAAKHTSSLLHLKLGMLGGLTVLAILYSAIFAVVLDSGTQTANNIFRMDSISSSARLINRIGWASRSMELAAWNQDTVSFQENHALLTDSIQDLRFNLFGCYFGFDGTSVGPSKEPEITNFWAQANLPVQLYIKSNNQSEEPFTYMQDMSPWTSSLLYMTTAEKLLQVPMGDFFTSYAKSLYIFLEVNALADFLDGFVFGGDTFRKVTHAAIDLLCIESLALLGGAIFFLFVLGLGVFRPIMRHVQRKQKGIGSVVKKMPPELIAHISGLYAKCETIGGLGDSDDGSQDDRGLSPGGDNKGGHLVGNMVGKLAAMSGANSAPSSVVPPSVSSQSADLTRVPPTLEQTTTVADIISSISESDEEPAPESGVSSHRSRSSRLESQWENLVEEADAHDAVAFIPNGVGGKPRLESRLTSSHHEGRAVALLQANTSPGTVVDPIEEYHPGSRSKILGAFPIFPEPEDDELDQPGRANQHEERQELGANRHTEDRCKRSGLGLSHTGDTVERVKTERAVERERERKHSGSSIGNGEASSGKSAGSEEHTQPPFETLVSFQLRRRTRSQDKGRDRAPSREVAGLSQELPELEVSDNPLDLRSGGILVKRSSLPTRRSSKVAIDLQNVDSFPKPGLDGEIVDKQTSNIFRVLTVRYVCVLLVIGIILACTVGFSVYSLYLNHTYTNQIYWSIMRWYYLSELECLGREIYIHDTRFGPLAHLLEHINEHYVEIERWHKGLLFGSLDMNLIASVNDPAQRHLLYDTRTCLRMNESTCTPDRVPNLRLVQSGVEILWETFFAFCTQIFKDHDALDETGVLDLKNHRHDLPDVPEYNITNVMTPGSPIWNIVTYLSDMEGGFERSTVAFRDLATKNSAVTQTEMVAALICVIVGFVLLYVILFRRMITRLISEGEIVSHLLATIPPSCRDQPAFQEYVVTKSGK